jgi:DNA-binding MarR family transcriptional regulator
MSAARQTLRNLLMSRHEWLYDRAFATAADYGYGDVTPAMARLFVQVARGPISISELARRLAISRQSVHETVSTACDLGLVELADDPADRRVRIVQLTAATPVLRRCCRWRKRRIIHTTATARHSSNWTG